MKELKRLIILEGNKNGRFVIDEFKKQSNAFYFSIMYLKKIEHGTITPLFLCKIGSIDLRYKKFIILHCFLQFDDVELFVSHYKERLGLK